MTFKEKLQMEHPELIDEEGYCEDCPEDYGYEVNSVCIERADGCRVCWDRVIPGTEDKEMTKAELKDGMICELRNGSLYIWLNGMPRSFSGHLTGIGMDLKNEDGYKEFDIINVYKTDGKNLNKMLDRENLTLIWERKEPKEMTLEDIERELGYPVKIVSAEGQEA